MRFPSGMQSNDQFDYLDFGGGLDLITPSYNTRPGTCRLAQNFEIGINEGYNRSTGYERFDGQAKPTDASFAIYDVTITGSFSVGDTITGATTAATAVVVAVVTSGAQDYLVITKISGTFNGTEDLEVSASVEGNADAAPVVDGASTIKLKAQYENLAADEYRGDIAAVTGEGDILGVFVLNDIVYAWRNAVGGASAALYKSSASGWTSVGLGKELSFTSGGTTEIAVGDTITGATSGATATITGITVESGTWGAGTAAGRFIFASQTGTFQSENIDVGVSTNLATIAGDSSNITMSPDGRFETIKHNFGGQSGTTKIYGCDGVNRGWEFDGTTFIPIDTGMTTDTPLHVHAFKNHLFFSFSGSAQHSGIGDPYAFTIVTGASELAVGDTITGFLTQPGGEGDASLAIFSRNRIHVLYGTSSSDWVLVQYREEIGAYDYSIQQVSNRTMFLDDRGVSDLSTTQAFGNFNHSTLSRLIQPWVNERKTKIVASCIARDKQQFRLFFSDKSALFITMDNNKVVGMMPQLWAEAVTCCISEEANDGSEVMYFGSTDGFVYQMEKGTSHDGDAIDAYVTLHYHHSGSPRTIKKYMDCAIEVAGVGYAEFNFTYELAYASTDKQQGSAISTDTLNFAAVNWDDGSVWDVGFWDSVSLTPSTFKLRGSAENISLTIANNSDYFNDIKVSGALLRLAKRRKLR